MPVVVAAYRGHYNWHLVIFSPNYPFRSNGRFVLRHRVVSAASPRVTAQNPLYTKPSAFENSIFHHCLNHILRAGGRVAARWRQHRANACAVEVNRQKKGFADYGLKLGHFVWSGSSLTSLTSYSSLTSLTSCSSKTSYSSLTSCLVIPFFLFQTILLSQSMQRCRSGLNLGSILSYSPISGVR